MPDSTRVELSMSSILKVIVTLLFFLLLYTLKDIIIIFLFALILASGISPFANWLQSKGLPRLLGVLFLYLVVFGLFIFIVSLVVPFISNDLVQLTTVFPKIVEKVSTSLDTVQRGAPKYFDFISEVQNLLDVFTGYLQQFSQSAVGFVVGVFGGLFSFAAIIIISFYLSVQKNGIESFLASVIPEKYERYAIDLWRRSEIKVGRWFQGQLLLALIMGFMVYVGLSLLKIKFALILGLLAMALEIVPVAGPVLAAIPAIFLAFIQDPTLGLWVIVFYIIAQQLENHVLVPLILGRTIGLNPVVVILALLTGGSLAGIPGAILSVPIATVIVEVIDDVARSKELRRGAI